MAEFFVNAVVVLHKHVSLSVDFFFSKFCLTHHLLYPTHIFLVILHVRIITYLNKSYNLFSQQKEYRFVLLFTANSRVNSSSDFLVTEGW